MKAGWTRPKIQEYLIEHAARPQAELIRLGIAQGPEREGDDQLLRRCSREPGDIIIVMGGGTGGRNMRHHRYNQLRDTDEENRSGEPVVAVVEISSGMLFTG